MFASKILRSLLGCALLMSFAGAANAFTITIERLSDTQGLITGSGFVSDNDFVADGVLDGNSGTPEAVFSSSDFNIGGFALTSVITDGAGTSLQFVFGNTGDNVSGSLSGSALITLTDTVWDDVGSSGEILGFTGSTWSIVAPSSVPEPGSLALLGLSLAGLGLSRRRRNA